MGNLTSATTPMIAGISAPRIAAISVMVKVKVNWTAGSKPMAVNRSPKILQ